MAGRHQPISVKASIRTSLCGVLIAVSVTALAAHEFLRRQDAHLAAHDRTRVVAETIALQFDAADTGVAGDFQRICRGMLESPSMLAICVWDGNGDRIACAGREPEHSTMLEVVRSQPPESLGPDAHFWTSHTLSSDSGPLDARFVPIGIGGAGERAATLGVLLDMRPMLGGFGQHLALYYFPVLFVGVISLTVGALRLKREVVGPMATLAAAASASDDERLDAHAFDGHKELGVLARAVNTLKLNALTWRRKAEMTERRTDTRVADETKRITRDLKHFQKAAWMDTLTNVYNRRFLDEKLPEVFDSQKSAGRDLSVVMFDLDNFKLLNDSEGHASGDAVLQCVGELLRQCTRQGDFAVRYGGDEFLLIMPGAPAARAMVVADRIMTFFAQQTKVMVSVRPAPSISAGVASIVDNQPASLREAMEMADEVLLSAKQAGKACVQLSMRRGTTAACPVRLARIA